MVLSSSNTEKYTQFNVERCQVSAQELTDRGSAKWADRTRNGERLDGAWIAEMDFGSAPAVEAALEKAIRDGFFGYLPNWLHHQLRESFADWQNRRHGWEITPDQVFLLPDVLSSFKALIELCSQPGDAIIIPTPAYMPFLTIPGQLNRSLIEIPSRIGADGRWEMDWERLEAVFAGQDPLTIGKKAPIVVLCNPHNPTGRVFSEAELRRFGDLAIRYQKWVFNDEIHAPLVRAGYRHCSFAGLDPAYAARTVTASAASKGWNVAGLKCAQMVLTAPDLIKRFKASGHLAELSEGASPFGALAAVAAYTEGEVWLDEALNYLHLNALEMQQVLSVATPKVQATVPEGTYLSLWNPGEYAQSARQRGFANPVDWMATAGVAVNGGTALGRDWPWLIRFNLATPRPLLRQMVQRCAEVLNPLD